MHSQSLNKTESQLAQKNAVQYGPSIDAALSRSSDLVLAEVNQKVAETDDKKADTSLKKLYAHWFMGILIGQLLVMSLVFIAVGLGWLHYNDENALRLYMGGTLTEVFGVVLVITRYLFSKK